MRTSTRVFIATLASIGTLILPSMSFATDARTAIRLCDRNPNCSYTVTDAGDVDIFVGDDIILCPQDGACTCVCTHRQVQALGGRGNVTGLLNNRPSVNTLAR